MDIQATEHCPGVVDSEFFSSEVLGDAAHMGKAGILRTTSSCVHSACDSWSTCTNSEHPLWQRKPIEISLSQ